MSGYIPTPYQRLQLKKENQVIEMEILDRLNHGVGPASMIWAKYNYTTESNQHYNIQFKIQRNTKYQILSQIFFTTKDSCYLGSLQMRWPLYKPDPYQDLYYNMTNEENLPEIITFDNVLITDIYNWLYVYLITYDASVTDAFNYPILIEKLEKID